MKNWLHQFWTDEGGLTIVEYAVGGALISAAAVLAFTGLGEAVSGKVTEITGFINDGATP
ncbi:MAG: Flp family type IVb pilin [Steroidobacteraceae bacterium]